MDDIFGLSPIILDLKNDTYKEIEIHQFDDVVLFFDLVNYGLPINLTNYTIEFRCVKPTIPESYVVQSTNITKNSNGRVTIACKEDIVNISGNVNCELRLISNDNSQLTTFNIILIVKKSVLDGVNKGQPFVMDILGELNETLSNAEHEDTNLKTTTTSAQTMDSTLKTTTSLADTKNTTLQGTIGTSNTAITNINTAIINVNTSKTDITNTMNTATTFKGTFSNDINNIMTPATNLKTDLTTIVNSAKQEEANILNQNNIASLNASTLNAFKTTLPSYLELLHTNYNIIEMLCFMERFSNTRANSVNNNMYIDSLIDSSKVTLDTITYNNTNKQILIGDGYIQTIAYWYE